MRRSRSFNEVSFAYKLSVVCRDCPSSSDLALHLSVYLFIYFCSQCSLDIGAAVFALQSLPSDLSECLCLAVTGQHTCAGLWPCILLPYKAIVQLNAEGRVEAEHRPRGHCQTQPEAEVPTAVNISHPSCLPITNTACEICSN